MLRQPRGLGWASPRAASDCWSSVMLLRALEVYETDRLDFAEAYLVAQAERSGIGVVASFDKAIDRLATVRRLEPA